MPSANITVIGSLFVDHIFFIDRLPDLGETYPASRYQKALGGKGANAAIAAYRSCHAAPTSMESLNQSHIDVHVRMMGAVREDEDSRSMQTALKENHVDVFGVRTEEDKTTWMTFIVVEAAEGKDGSPDNRLIYTIGANAALEAKDFTTVRRWNPYCRQPARLESRS